MFNAIMATLASVKLLCEKTLSGLFRSPNRRQTQALVIDRFRYIKMQPKTIDLSTGLWGISPTNSVVIPQSLALRSIVLGLI